MKGFRSGDTAQTVYATILDTALDYYASHGSIVMPVPKARTALIARYTLEGRMVGAGAVSTLMDMAVAHGLASYVRVEDGALIPSGDDAEDGAGRYLLVSRDAPVPSGHAGLSRVIAASRARLEAIVMADPLAVRPVSPEIGLCLSCHVNVLIGGTTVRDAILITGGMASAVGFVPGRPIGYMHRRCFLASQGDLESMT